MALTMRSVYALFQHRKDMLLPVRVLCIGEVRHRPSQLSKVVATVTLLRRTVSLGWKLLAQNVLWDDASRV